MKKADRFGIVLVTAPTIAVARRLARLALKERLVACANLLPGVESHYWWREKIERSREILIVFKTLQSRVRKLEKLILAKHPYDTPEVLVLAIDSGARKYLRWIKDSCSPQQ